MNGKFVEVRIDATINLGNYSSEKIGVTYVMAGGEDIFGAIKMCKDVVYGRTVATNVEVVVDQKSTATAVEKKTPATATKKKEAPAAATATEPKQEETKAEEAPVQATETKEAAPTATAKRNIAKVKNTVYNRNNEEHKRLLSAFLDKAFPTWKSKDSIKKASEISSKLSEKEDFLDGEGVILESFKQKFLDGLK